MSAGLDAFGGYLALLVAGVLAHEPWRWLGFYLGRNVDPDGEVFRWVRAVSTALIAGLVMRLALFPAGALEGVVLGVRIGALVGGIVCFYAFRRNLAVGVASGAVLLTLGDMIAGALRW